MKLATAPMTDRPSRMTPIQISLPRNTNDEQAAGDGAEDGGEEGGRFEDAVAACDRMCGCRISGMAPYLAGAKKAACVPIRKTQDRTIQAPDAACRASVPR